MTEFSFDSAQEDISVKETIENMRERDNSRVAVIPAFIGMLVLSVCVYFALTKLAAISEGNSFIYDVGALMQGAAEGSVLWRIAWFLTDVTEGTFIGSLPATILVMVGSYIAAYMERHGKLGRGTGVDGNGQIFTIMTMSGFVSLIIGPIIFGGLFNEGLFVPSFATFLSVQAMIVGFQANNIAKAATVTILGTVTELPLCFWFVKHFTVPNNLPLFIAVGVSIVITVPICSEIMHRLPWMKQAPAEEAPAPVEEAEAAPVKVNNNLFFVNRVFGDVGEMILWGSSIGAILMYIGCIIATVLNPAHGMFNAAIVISTQIATGALAVFIWYPRWKNDGWAFTFAPLLFATAIAVTYTFSLKVMIPTIIIAAVCIPPLIPWVMGKIKPSGRWAPIACVLLSVCSICIPWSFFVGNVLQ